MDKKERGSRHISLYNYFGGQIFFLVDREQAAFVNSSICLISIPSARRKKWTICLCQCQGLIFFPNFFFLFSKDIIQSVYASATTGQ